MTIEADRAVDTGQSRSCAAWVELEGASGDNPASLELYIKRAEATWSAESKDAASLKRDLHSMRNEIMFYRNVAPALAKAGVARIPVPVF